MSDSKMNKYLFQIIYTFLYVIQFVLSMFVVGKVSKKRTLINTIKDVDYNDLQRTVLWLDHCRSCGGAFHMELIELF